MDKTKVTFAYPYTDEAGKDHKPKTTAALDFFEARTVINSGIAQLAEDSPKTEASKEK